MSKRRYEYFSPGEDLSGHDYIIVGSGIGGLTAAIFLAKAGKKVLVLEKHYVPGGFMHTFRRKKGLEWDVGVHYVGAVEEGSPVRMMFDYLTDNRLQWASMGEIYDRAIFGKDVYDFPCGEDNLRANLHRAFPEEKAAIDAYFTEVKRAHTLTSLYLASKALPPTLRYTLGIFWQWQFRRHATETTAQVLDRLTRNDKLKAVLCTQCGDYGLTPGHSSFAAHAMVVNHFLNGAYYPEGGADKIYRNMIDVLYEHGGRVLVKADVSEIVTRRKRVEGVRVNGNFIACRNVISNAGARNTYRHLLRNTPLPATAAVDTIKPSCAHICLYLGLDQDAETLNLPKHNVWYYSDYNIEQVLEKSLDTTRGDIPFAYISFPSAKDPHWNKQHRNTSTIQAISVSDIRQFDAFSEQPWLHRGENYDALKQRFTEQMLERLYELFPQIRGHVIHTEVSTPLSTRHFMNYEDGEIYGLEHSPARFALDCLGPVTPIKGLYLTGQDITMVGVSAAMLSGILTVVNILKWKIITNFKDMGRYRKAPPQEQA